jgi:hypothetical protein
LVRTFNLGNKEIDSIYGIVITYNRSLRSLQLLAKRNDRLMESFEIIDALKISSNLSNHLILEKRKPLGTKQYELFNSCHQKTGMKFVFPIPNIGRKNRENTQRKVQPLALKEGSLVFNCKRLERQSDKTFGLDRNNQLKITSTKFYLPKATIPQKLLP